MTTVFAKINEENRVIDLMVASQDVIDSFDDAASWIQTWADANGEASKRYNFASKGSIYIKDNNAFTTPKQFESWVMDEKFDWQPPMPSPDNGKSNRWDEPTKSWVEA